MDGYAELSPGLLGAYPCKTVIPGFPVGADVTIEYRLQAVNNTGFATYFSETNNRSTSGWDHFTYLNSYGQPDNIVDRMKSSDNLAPEGFDGSAVHTFRLVRQGDASLFYLFDNGIPFFIAELEYGGGAAWDERNLMFGIPSGGEIYRFHYLRIASGAHIPQPIPTPGAFILGSIGLAFSSWKLRRKRNGEEGK